MSARTVDNLFKQVLALTPEEQREFRAKLNAQSPFAAENDFDRMMQESGIGRPRKPGPRGANPRPIYVEGKPISEQLIEERR